jgi:hypothetical protein
MTRCTGPWTLPDPWTRGRAHRSLEIAPRFPQAPTAIIVV